MNGSDFSTDGKAYIRKSIETVMEEIGHQQKSCSVEVYPFDYYFMQLRDNLPVEYFIRRMEHVYEQRSIVLSNIGRLLYADAEELVATFAYASNNYVGTAYTNVKIDRIDRYYRTLPKPKILNKPVCQNVEYVDMFKQITHRASDNLYRLEDIDICKPLLTAEWLYNNISDVDGFDNTFIYFGYLKLVEILLSKIIVECYAGQTMSINRNSDIVISTGIENQLMLGNMVRFITRNPASELYHSPHQRKVSQAISSWTTNIRNGYFHKHAMGRERVDEIRNNTFEIIYMVLGTVPR